MASANPWLSKQNTYSDLAITKPLPITFTTNPYPAAYIGPRHSNTPSNSPFVQNFHPPRYEPNSSPVETVNNQNTGNVPQQYPIVPIVLRNQWEVTNTTNPLLYGGFDAYNIYTIPSAADLNGDYMNFTKFTIPENRVYVEQYEDLPTEINSHSSWSENFSR